MKTQQTPWIVSLSILSVCIAGAALLRSADLSVTREASAASRDAAAATLQSSNPTYAYSRLVFTVAGNAKTVWLNTPTNALSASFGIDSTGSLDSIGSAIQATASNVQFPSGVPVDDMLLVQWMGLAQWELVAVTQNQVDAGVTTSYYFRRKS
jgi:hypothetical protein